MSDLADAQAAQRSFVDQLTPRRRGGDEDLSTDAVARRQNEEARDRLAARPKRTPRVRTQAAPALKLPERPSWKIIGSATINASLLSLHRALQTHARGMRAKQRARVERALVELEAAISGEAT